MICIILSFIGTDEKNIELSASNALLVSQSEATKSQLSSLEIKFRETEGVLEVCRSELKELRMNL